MIQDERASGPFDTLGVLGWDRDADRYFARTIENHGFARDYSLMVSGRVWTLEGDSERATFEFSHDGRTQIIAWERKVETSWLPLCDRTATRIQ